MRSRAFVLVLAAGSLYLPSLYSQPKPATYSSATLLRVQEREPNFRYIGQPSDAPLTSESHTYKVSVQQGCTIYVGQWQSDSSRFIQDLPPNTQVQVDVHGHSLHMKYRGDDLDMALVGRERVPSCSASQ